MAKRWLVLALAALGVAALPISVVAEAYPTKPVSLVVGFATGGPSDIIARIMANHLGEAFKQPFVVENKPGAASNIAADLVAKAKPDGYTLLLGNVGSLAVNDALYSNLPFHPERDFTIIAMTAQTPLVLAIEPKLPATNLKQFIDYAKSSRGQINYASPGVGIPPHFAAEMFRGKVGFQSTNVQYRSGGMMIDALMKGEVQWAFDVPATISPQHLAGKVRALAVAAAQRWPTMPDVPTMAELGFDDFEVIGWFAIAGPAGLPGSVVEQLNAEVRRALASEDIKQKLANIGFAPQPTTAADASKFIAAERKRWLAVAKEHNIKVE
jgi:tripartite-type tricarboxylate transporter receptor subunit TctC